MGQVTLPLPLLSRWPPLCHFSHNEPLEAPQTRLRAPPTSRLNTNYSLAWNNLTAFIYPPIIARYLGVLCPPQPIQHTNPNTMLSACCFPCPCVSHHHQSQFSSVAQSCPTLCNPMNCSTPGLPVHHQLPEFTQTHVHRVGDSIQPSHPLSSPSPPAPNPSQHQGLFQGVSS